MVTKTVKPCGMLYAGDRQYYLLHPTPLVADTLPQGDWTRFLVSPFANLENYERHLIVHGDWVIEYKQMDEITIAVLEDKPDDELVYNYDLEVGYE
jgi:hypothetical protein